MDELAELYRRLAKQAHPDVGTPAERGIRRILMQQINASFDAKDLDLLRRLASEIDDFAPPQAAEEPSRRSEVAFEQQTTGQQTSVTQSEGSSHPGPWPGAHRTEAEQRRLNDEAIAATEAYLQASKWEQDGATIIDGKAADERVKELLAVSCYAQAMAAPSEWEWEALWEQARRFGVDLTPWFNSKQPQARGEQANPSSQGPSGWSRDAAREHWESNVQSTVHLIVSLIDRGRLTGIPGQWDPESLRSLQGMSGHVSLVEELWAHRVEALSETGYIPTQRPHLDASPTVSADEALVIVLHAVYDRFIHLAVAARKAGKWSGEW